MLDNTVSHKTLRESVGPLGTGGNGSGPPPPGGMMPNPAMRSGAELDEQGRTSGFLRDWSVPVNS